MKLTTNDLIATLEKLRSTKHPDLDPILVREVVAAQADYMANPNEALKRIYQAVEAHLTRKETP
jgi:hypothetical protein